MLLSHNTRVKMLVFSTFFLRLFSHLHSRLTNIKLAFVFRYAASNSSTLGSFKINQDLQSLYSFPPVEILLGHLNQSFSYFHYRGFNFSAEFFVFRVTRFFFAFIRSAWVMHRFMYRKNFSQRRKFKFLMAWNTFRIN